MNDLVTNLGWFAAGALFGIQLGWQLLTMRHARHTEREVEQLHHDDHGSIGQTIAIGVVVLLTVVAAFMANSASHDVRTVAKCNQRLLSITVTALNERTVFSDDSQAVERRVRSAQRDLVVALLSSRPAGELRDRGVAYQSAIEAAEDLAEASAGKRDRYPYPSAAQIRRCTD